MLSWGRKAGDFGGSCSPSLPALYPSSCFDPINSRHLCTTSLTSQLMGKRRQLVAPDCSSNSWQSPEVTRPSSFCSVTNNCKPQSHIQELLFQWPENKERKKWPEVVLFTQQLLWAFSVRETSIFSWNLALVHPTSACILIHVTCGKVIKSS